MAALFRTGSSHGYTEMLRQVVWLIAAVVLWVPFGCSHGKPDVSLDQPAQPAPSAVVDAELVEETWPDGALRLRKYVLRPADGKLINHGTYERWHDNGEREYEAVFVHGKKEGRTIRYHKNGRKWTVQEYRDGKRHGVSTTWGENGAKLKEEGWDSGKPHGTWTVWKKGKIKWRHTFEHGNPDP